MFDRCVIHIGVKRLNYYWYKLTLRRGENNAITLMTSFRMINIYYCKHDKLNRSTLVLFILNIIEIFLRKHHVQNPLTTLADMDYVVYNIIIMILCIVLFFSDKAIIICLSITLYDPFFFFFFFTSVEYPLF